MTTGAGGIEANAILELQHSGPSGAVKGQVRVSRTYHLRNRLLIRGTKAHAEIPADDPDSVVIRRQVGQSELSDTLRLPNFPAALRFTSNWIISSKASDGNQKLESNGWQALRVIELIEQCYANRRRIREPWSEVALPTDGAVR